MLNTRRLNKIQFSDERGRRRTTKKRKKRRRKKGRTECRG